MSNLNSTERKRQEQIPSPTVLENVRVLIKTNGAQCIATEEAIENAGFKIINKELAKSVYTNFYRAKYGSTTLILKKLSIGKLSMHNRELLLTQSVKVMRHLCSSNDDPYTNRKNKHFIYFIQIYEIFLLTETRSKSKEQVMLIFMEEIKNRTINNRMKKVAKVKWMYIKRWSCQIISAISYMHEKAVAHRALRLEHVLLDTNENIRLISWTRAVIIIDPVTGEPVMQPKEPCARRKNHLPPEVFLDKYDPANVDFWSLGVSLAVLCTKRFPFDPTTTVPFHMQWRQFCQEHQKTIRDDILNILNIIFDFNNSNIGLRIRQEEVREILTASSLETETDELAEDETDFVDVIEDPTSLGSSKSSKS